MQNTYKMTFKIKDWNGITKFSQTLEGDSPCTQDFVNFCYRAGIAYGFSESQMRNIIIKKSSI